MKYDDSPNCDNFTHVNSSVVLCDSIIALLDILMQADIVIASNDVRMYESIKAILVDKKRDYLYVNVPCF